MWKVNGRQTTDDGCQVMAGKSSHCLWQGELKKTRGSWPSGFREEYFFKSPNQKQELPIAAMFVNGSGQNEQSLERTSHRCFLPSFTSFGWEVSEEKIKMWKVNGRQTTYDGRRTPSDGKSSHCLWQGELKM
jgi:hypothetical protein